MSLIISYRHRVMASLTKLVLIFLVNSVSSQEYNNCPPGFTAHDMSCYAYIDHEMSWADAESTCVALGGFLPEVYNDDENNLLRKMSTDHGGHAIWIGGEDLVQENKWTWAKTGVPIDEYTDWAPNQPDNNHNGEENCMELNVNDYAGKWNDDECYNKQRFICQRYMADSVIG